MARKFCIKCGEEFQTMGHGAFSFPFGDDEPICGICRRKATKLNELNKYAYARKPKGKSKTYKKSGKGEKKRPKK